MAHDGNARDALSSCAGSDYQWLRAVLAVGAGEAAVIASDPANH